MGIYSSVIRSVSKYLTQIRQIFWLKRSDFEVHAYLAGPDVFEENAIDIGDANKKHLMEEYRIHGHFPFDNELPKDGKMAPEEIALWIAKANEDMMHKTCGYRDGKYNLGVIIANMNPFHGPSMDIGTGFEMGFFSALSRFYDALIVGYSADKRSFGDKVAQDYYKGEVHKVEKRGLVGKSDNRTIEDFGNLRDNLMMEGALRRDGNGAHITEDFESAAQMADRLANIRINKIIEKHNNRFNPVSWVQKIMQRGGDEQVIVR